MAVTVTATALAQALGVNQALADRLLPVVTALVQQYAPVAPSAVQDEAAVRCAGWLAEQPAASIRSESTGDVSTAYNTTSTSPLRASGAMGLLTFWKVRRAGVIG